VLTNLEIEFSETLVLTEQLINEPQLNTSDMIDVYDVLISD